MKENDKNKRAHDNEMKKIDSQIAAWIEFQKGNGKKIEEISSEVKS